MGQTSEIKEPTMGTTPTGKFKVPPIVNATLVVLTTLLFLSAIVNTIIEIR
jgi:hypothetical protein